MTGLAGLAYLLFLAYIVLRLVRKPVTGVADYIVAGRRLTLPAFTASLVTTYYGGILGVGEYSWSYGASNWLVFGVPYYLTAAIFALFLARRARRSKVMTIPDLLEQRFGRPAALVGAGILFLMTAPAAYVLMLGVLLSLATGIPLWLGVVLGTSFSLAYVFRGGLQAVVATDIIQFFLMFLAFMVLVPVCVIKFGGWQYLKSGLPEAHLSWDGGLGPQAILVWYFIALATLVEPAFYQRCYAAKTEKTAQWGIVLSIVFWIFFDFLTTTAGLYARVLLPDLANPVEAFPRLAALVLPSFWQGMFTVGLLATIMSTVDSYSFIGAVTLGRDLIQRWRGELTPALPGHESPENDGTSLPIIRWSLLATGVLAVVLALAAGSVIKIWKMVGSVGTPMLLLPLVFAHLKRSVPSARIVTAMLAAGFVSLAWLILGHGGAYLGLEAIFPGLIVSILILLPSILRR